MKILVAVLIAVAASVVAVGSHAEVKYFPRVGEDDRLQIQEIIGAQLKAFHSKDAEKAFSYASPSIQDKFEVKGVWIQGVIISDDLGETWLAQYPMELQPDGNWLINGCVVRALEDRSL